MSNLSEEEIIFKNEYLQKPISFLTQENLEKLEQHCEKTIRYATRNLLKEHQIILELIDRYKEMNKEIRNLKEKNKELIQGQVKTLDEILQPELLKKYISKDKIRKIIYPTPTNPISYEIQSSDMYKKLEQLLEEK